MSERARGRVTGPAMAVPVPPPVRGHHVPVEIERIIIAGRPGQGIGSTGKAIAHAGMLRGHNVTWLPIFSPTISSASEQCTVLVSREEIGSPLAGVPDIVLAFDAPDYELFKLRIKAGGLMIYNSSAIELLPESFRDDIRTIGVPASDLARELGGPRLTSLVMLGAYVGSSKLLDEKSVNEALRKLPSGETDHAPEQTRRALDEGLRYVRERRYMYNRYAYSIFMK